jgi:hypothetical protein
MTDGEQLTDYLARPRRYENIDGLLEASAGLTFMGWALCMYVQYQHLFPGSGWIMLVTAFFIWPRIVRRWMNSLKQRFTYPRTGFAQPKGPSKKKRIISVATAAIFPILSIASWRLLRGHSPAIWYAFFWGFVSIYGYLRLNWQRMPARWPFVAVLLVTALVAGARGKDFTDVMEWQFGALGAVMLVSGALTFRLYLLHTRPENAPQ